MIVINEASTNDKGLTWDEFRRLAKDNSTKGGLVVLETWEKYQFDDYVKQFGPMTKKDALALFKLYHNTRNEP